jgi:hypothetical protein
MAEQPPLSRIHVVGYSSNDRDFPIVSLVADPRVAGYRVPEDLSVCPDKRYPNHVFTGAQPLSGDERVRHTWEILPSPYVPFTRYDDDLGPVQGRRRFVVNSGQEASLERDKKVSYEAREGSAIVSSEIEETWDAGSTDPDLDSPFPIRDRDVYDERLGPVKERRQIIAINGDEKASLEFSSPTITQISYEPYNEFLSYKIIRTHDLNGPIRREDIYDPLRGPIQRLSQVIYDTGNLNGSLINQGGTITQTIYQPVNTLVVDRIVETYRVDGPQLVGYATNNEKQLTTVTTQRKGSDGYTPPDPTATKTIEVNREDAESIVERVIDAPEVFDNKTVSSSKPDVLPERFRASLPTETTQETIEQDSVEIPSLEEGDLERSEERVSKFTVRKSAVSRNIDEIPDLDGIDYEESFDVQIPYTEKISTTIPTGSAEAVPLDDTRYLVREYDKDNIETYLEDFLQTYPTTISMDLPRVLDSVTVEWDEKTSEGSYVNDPRTEGVFYTFSNEDKGEASTTSSATPLVGLNFRDVWSKNIPATVFIFFLKNPIEEGEILSKTGSSQWPTFKPQSHIITGKGVELRASVSVKSSISIQQPKPFEFSGYSDSSKQKDFSRSITPIIVNIPPCLHGVIAIAQSKSVTATIAATASTAGIAGALGSLNTTETASISDTASITAGLGSTSPTDIPKSGKYLIDSNVDFFKYGFSIVRATVIDASVFA